MAETFEPTLAAARARIAAVRPAAYARTRNALDGAVSGLSPYLTHGLVTLADVLAGVVAHHPLSVQHKFVYELGWRAYFRHVWQHRGAAILRSLHAGPLPESAYASELPRDIRDARTGVPVVDQAVRMLYATGMLHNHARMWLASYVVHVRQVHWRAGADWLYGHLLDGDLASNHLSWQWVAGTGSSKPYLFNAANVARYAPAAWHSPGSVIDTSYEALDAMSRQPRLQWQMPVPGASSVEPGLLGAPPAAMGAVAPNAAAVAGREVWLVHPWRLGELPAGLPPEVRVVGLFVAHFHRAWPWSERRWRFVGSRMAELAAELWHGEAADIATALKAARSVRSITEPHLAPWLPGWADCEAAPALFPPVDQRCDSFSKWWRRATRGLDSAADLLAVNEVPAW
ncbi:MULTISPECIES: FAD-binding domain-containing protein [unclassified Roseateles]|uniref:FAD-binding domain-containing protein n=1 Tax=unclassified Roseateles TaxID=2626991 RepID=UPI0006FE47CF|nr:MULTISPECIES: FAD-binding domain-containing protein [unclassified Roseateles]KQW43343.1 deoxyribodipyrimidine photolyase [Pelomonas sp. Root405]KRA71081.1 deoxyribodipyrimidine photolyase [Pelomonas sp. Root662]